MRSAWFLCRSRCRSSDDHVRAAALGQLEHRVDRVGFAGADRAIRLDDVGSHVQPFPAELDEEHPRSTASTGKPNVQATDGTRADDDDIIARTDAHELLRIDGTGKRLGDGGLSEADALGDPVEPVDGEHLRRHNHVFGKPTVEVVTHRDLARADRHVPGETVWALSARDCGDDLHPIPRRPASHTSPHLHDLARNLVAHHARRNNTKMTKLRDLHVSSAGRTGAHTDFNLTFTRRGL